MANKFEIHPFEYHFHENDDQVTFGKGYIFDLGNHWFEDKTNKRTARKIIPINFYKRFPKSNQYYLNIYFDRTGYGEESNYGFIYKCKISEEKGGDESVLIWKNGKQILSDNIVYDGLTQLGGGYLVLSKFSADILKPKATYTVLRNNFFDWAGNILRSEKEKTFQVDIDLEDEPRIKWAIFYRVSSVLAWKERVFSEAQKDFYKRLKRARIVAESEEYESEEEMPLPSISDPWGTEDLDMGGIESTFSIEIKEIKSKTASLLSQSEKKDWNKLENGDDRTLISILRIGYIYSDGKIEMNSAGFGEGVGLGSSTSKGELDKEEGEEEEEEEEEEELPPDEEENGNDDGGGAGGEGPNKGLANPVVGFV